jgi:hypothetical protein
MQPCLAQNLCWLLFNSLYMQHAQALLLQTQQALSMGNVALAVEAVVTTVPVAVLYVRYCCRHCAQQQG